MKALIVLVLLLTIGLIIVRYRRDGNGSKMLFSFAILGEIIVLSVMGNVMRSIMPLFIGHVMALIVAYGGLLLYIVRGKTQWVLWMLPLLSLMFYFLLAWIGNEHVNW